MFHGIIDLGHKGVVLTQNLGRAVTDVGMTVGGRVVGGVRDVTNLVTDPLKDVAEVAARPSGGGGGEGGVAAGVMHLNCAGLPCIWRRDRASTVS